MSHRDVTAPKAAGNPYGFPSALVVEPMASRNRSCLRYLQPQGLAQAAPAAPAEAFSIALVPNWEPGFPAAYLQRAGSLGWELRGLEARTEPSAPGPCLQPSSSRSKCQGQWDHSPALSNGAKVPALDREVEFSHVPLATRPRATALKGKRGHRGVGIVTMGTAACPAGWGHPSHWVPAGAGKMGCLALDFCVVRWKWHRLPPNRPQELPSFPLSGVTGLCFSSLSCFSLHKPHSVGFCAEKAGFCWCGAEHPAEFLRFMVHHTSDAQMSSRGSLGGTHGAWAELLQLGVLPCLKLL